MLFSIVNSGEIPDFNKFGNGDEISNGQQAKNKKSNNQQEFEFGKLVIEAQIKHHRKEHPDLSFEYWSDTLIQKRRLLNQKVSEYFPTMELLLDFELSVKTILNIQDITLPFMGIVFAVPSSLKTAFFKFLRNIWYSYYTDKFTARAFVSHSANVAKDKLHEIDMLPAIKDRILLTPELSALFGGKDDDVREQFGLITRVLDGEGLETNSGVHGKLGYYGNYMFTWLGAAVDIPYSVYKFLSTIGFKIYFLRLPRTEVSRDDLIGQLTSKTKFGEKTEEIEKLLLDYLTWFEICPISIGQNKNAKIEWDTDKDDIKAIEVIAEHAILLAHLRGSVVVYRSSEHPDLVPFDNNAVTEPGSDATVIQFGEKGKPHYSENNGSSKKSTIPNYNNSEGFSHRLPIIENPRRAAQQLYNLARGHALSYGRNYITRDDLPLVIKVVLSTSLIERTLILDLLIAYKGTLTTSDITKSLNISNNSAKRTMTEFKGLELVTMDQIGNSSNAEYRITLKSKFEWFLTDEFQQLRDGYQPIDYKENLGKKKFAVTKNTLVHVSPTIEDQPLENQDQGNESNNTPTRSDSNETHAQGVNSLQQGQEAEGPEEEEAA